MPGTGEGSSGLHHGSCAVPRGILKRRACGHIAFCEPIGAQYWLRELLVEESPRADCDSQCGRNRHAAQATRSSRRSSNGTAAILDEVATSSKKVPPEYDVVICELRRLRGSICIPDLHGLSP